MKFTSRIVTDDLSNILEGITKAANVVTSTMGGAGKNVILSTIDNNSRQTDNIVFTKDGVSVARSLRFENREQNIGAQLLINAANQTVKQHGDGTTLTSLFVKVLIEELFKFIESKPDYDINQLLNAVKIELEEIKDMVVSNKKDIDSNSDIYHVAYTSSKSPNLASFIAEIYSKTGLNANIGLEMSRTSNSTYYNIVQGLTFESGYIHSGFMNQDNGVCYFERPFILITNNNVVAPDDYEEVIGECFNNNQPIVFIAPNFSDAFIRFCLSNIQRKGLEICLIRTPGYGAAVKENIKDITAFINGDGTCSSIKVTALEFTIYNEPEKQRVKSRIDVLKKMADGAVEDYDEKSYLQRISNLQQSTAIIFVGGVTEKNAKEEYDRLEDAVGAVKSAIKTGYVRGCGVEIMQAYRDQGDIVKTLCFAPYKKILDNARIDYSKFDPTKPYNIRTKKYDDNLIDPVGVIISSIDNAFALTELVINTSYIIHNEE